MTTFINIDEAVNDWYGLANTSIFSIPQDILENKVINAGKPPQGFSIANVLNRLFKVYKKTEKKRKN